MSGRNTFFESAVQKILSLPTLSNMSSIPDNTLLFFASVLKYLIFFNIAHIVCFYHEDIDAVNEN